MKRLLLVMLLMAAMPALAEKTADQPAGKTPEKKADDAAGKKPDKTGDEPAEKKAATKTDKKADEKADKSADKKSDKKHHSKPAPRDVLPDLSHDRVDYWVAEFSKDKDYHKKIAAGFERKAKYQDMLQRKLRKRGMPQNLIYLAFEESAFNPVARSSQAAAGIWQLTPATAKLYGLKVGKKRDERLQVEKETDAALKFLDHLYDCFGSWYLAAAAYNAGPNKIKKIMKRKLRRHTGSDRDYYRIWDDLPPQTRDYVPAIIALKRIGKEPAKYGF